MKPSTGTSAQDLGYCTGCRFMKLTFVIPQKVPKPVSFFCSITWDSQVTQQEVHLRTLALERGLRATGIQKTQI